MLKNFIFSNLPHSFILIQDSHSARGYDIYKSILANDLNDNTIKAVHLVCCENPPEYYKTSLDVSKVVVHDFFKDPLGWLGGNGTNCYIKLKELVTCKDITHTVMIDSLNTFCYIQDVYHICNVIHDLKNGFRKVTCLLHGDSVKEAKAIRYLSFFSNVSLRVQMPINSDMTLGGEMNSKWKGVEGMCKKSNGKVVAVKDIYIVDADWNFSSKICEERRDNKVCSNVKENFRNMTTFRLGLDIRENEKIARKNLVLPYLRTGYVKDDKDEKEGKIIYDAEAEDDLEEDPDDDLDI